MSVVTTTRGAVHVVAVDDGHTNTINIEVAEGLLGALRTAEGEASAVVITGRPGFYSSGLDVETFAAGGEPASELLHMSTELILRLVEFPRPVVAACTGTALGAAAVSLLCCDYRIGAVGDYKISINYVSLGLAVPDLALELARSRLSPRQLTLACNTAYLYAPEEAARAGFLDALTDEDTVEQAISTAAAIAKRVDPAAFAATRRLTCRSLTDSIIRSAGDLWRMQHDA